MRSARGQASMLLIGGMIGVLIAAVITGAVARAVGEGGGKAQRAADLAAVAAARVMNANYPRLFEPAVIDGVPNPRHLEKADYLGLGRDGGAAGRRRQRRAGASTCRSRTRTRSRRCACGWRWRERVAVGKGAARHREADARRRGRAGPGGDDAFATGGGYSGPLAYRQGKPMRPDVAQAFDRMEAAASADGVALTINSAFRSDAEQAVLFARHPDPKWVARPGTSLHRNGTELDLGPPAAYGWLAANATRFHFIQRYPWEAWHYGYTLNAASCPSATAATARRACRTVRSPGSCHSSSRPSSRTPPSAGTSPRPCSPPSSTPSPASTRSRVSGAGAQGIAQFMPGTARAYGLDNPFDAEQAINAQAHLMRDLLRQFGCVPLALAAYNAGPGPVRACMCVPNYPGDQGYVARILGLMSGAGQPLAPGDGIGLTVRLVSDVATIPLWRFDFSATDPAPRPSRSRREERSWAQWLRCRPGSHAGSPSVHSLLGTGASS